MKREEADDRKERKAEVEILFVQVAAEVFRGACKRRAAQRDQPRRQDKVRQVGAEEGGIGVRAGRISLEQVVQKRRRQKPCKPVTGADAPERRQQAPARAGKESQR